MRKGEATRARIVDAAARLAAVRGLTAVSLADVAEVVGLSKSGLFKHFESKEDMHMAVVEAVMHRFRDFVWTPAESRPSGRGRLEAVFAPTSRLAVPGTVRHTQPHAADRLLRSFDATSIRDACELIRMAAGETSA